MGALRDKMQQDLELGGYAAVTKKVYLSAAADFARHFGRSPARMGQDEVRAYIRYLVEHKQLKSQRLRQHMAGLKSPKQVRRRRAWRLKQRPARSR